MRFPKESWKMQWSEILGKIIGTLPSTCFEANSFLDFSFGVREGKARVDSYFSFVRTIFLIDFSVERGFSSTNNLSTYLKVFVFMRHLSSKSLTFNVSRLKCRHFQCLLTIWCHKNNDFSLFPAPVLSWRKNVSIVIFQARMSVGLVYLIYKIKQLN